VRLFTDSYLPDTDNVVPFKNTTSINQNKNGKVKKRRADSSDLSKWYFRRVQCCQCQTNLSQ